MTDQLYAQRHSLAHILAQAVLEMRPGSKRGFGPPIENGFYYDFVLTEPITPDEFSEVEERMRRIIAEDQTFERQDFSIPQAISLLEEMGEAFKIEYLHELVRSQGIDSISFYSNGPFIDMCQGPHVMSTAELDPLCFKLRATAGAYWRGDARNLMMTRIYAWAFSNQKELASYLEKYESRLARDHKKLGPALELYMLDPEVGKGLPLWLPNGTAIREEIEKLAKEKEFQAGYHRVATPHITRADLYRLSGHLDHYKDKMYPPMIIEDTATGGDGALGESAETYYLKPMNCPHHHRIFSARPRSYRELPIRLAEFGEVYRFEASGELSGLLRVRGMCQNDAHIYCTPEQLKDEFIGVMRLQQEYLDLFGLTDYYFRLSLCDFNDLKGREKFIDDHEMWAVSEAAIREAMKELGLPYREAPGEAAFYGPKIDVQFATVTGREETFCTTQVDFAVPRADRMNLTYTDAGGILKHPCVIHRAPLGSHERFVAYLIEHFGGAFPVWLAPIQVRVVPVSDRFRDYAEEVTQRLRRKFVRAELDLTDEGVGKKVRRAIVQKIPRVVVVGEREASADSVTIRRHGRKEETSLSFDDFEKELLLEIRERRLETSS